MAHRLPPWGQKRIQQWDLENHIENWRTEANAIWEQIYILRRQIAIRRWRDFEIAEYRRNRLRIYLANASWTLTARLYEQEFGSHNHPTSVLLCWAATVDNALLQKHNVPLKYLSLIRGLGPLIKQSGIEAINMPDRYETRHPRRRAYPYQYVEIEFARFLLDPAFKHDGYYWKHRELVAVVYGKSVEELAAELNPSDVLDLANAAPFEIEEGRHGTDH